MKGILQVKGSLSVSQFWPQGQSDADTAKLLIDVGKEAFTFRETPKAPSKVIHLEKAVVHGRITRPVLQRGKVTVRLQSIDAAELHFTPQAMVPVGQQEAENHQRFLRFNYAFRQPLAEQAVIALTGLLGSTQEALSCRIETRVDDPAEAFDCYGRLIGDVIVTVGKKEVNLNRWLVRSGWAFPSLYDSMSPEELKATIKNSEEARKKKLGVWSVYSAQAQQLNWALRYRKSANTKERSDLRLILPKLFRRLVTFSVNQRAGLFYGSFRDYLKSHPDACYLTDDFLKNGHEAKRYRLEEFLLPHGLLEVEPHQLVFCEAPSSLTGLTEVSMSKKKEVQAPRPTPKPVPPKPGQPIPSPLPPPQPKPPNPGPTNPPAPR